MSDLWKKLKEDSIGLLVAALLGIPAWGILLSQIFSILSTSGSIPLSYLFKAFCLIYFTIPFFAMFLLVIFMLKGEIMEWMRTRMMTFIFCILGLMAVYLLALGCLPRGWLSWLLLYFAFFSSLAFIFIYVRSLWKGISIYSHNLRLENPAEDVERPILINFSIFFLFIPIQWIIVVLVTANHLLYASFIFDIICLFAYFIPLFVYSHWQKGFRNTALQYSKLTSNNFIPRALIWFPVILTAILFFAGSIRRTFSFDLPTREDEYKMHFTMAKTLADTTTKELDFFDLVTKRDTIEDSLSKKLIAKNRYTAWMYTYAAQAPELDTDNIYYTLPLRGYHDSITKVRGLTFKAKEDLLVNYKHMLKFVAQSQIDIASTELYTVALEAQRTGIMALITTLLILAFILMVLYLKDEKYRFSDIKEIGRIRKVIAAVALVTGILLFPLLKVIHPEDIKPYEPYTLFKLGNWNLKDGGGKNNPLDSLNRKKPLPDCGCIPVVGITNNYFDSARVTLNGSNLKMELQDLPSLINSIDNLAEAVDTARAYTTLGQEPAKSSDSLVAARLTVLINTLKPPYAIQVKNWPDAITLRPVEEKLDGIYTQLRDYVAETAPTRYQLIPKDSLLNELQQIIHSLDKLNLKGSPLNQKSGKND